MKKIRRSISIVSLRGYRRIMPSKNRNKEKRDSICAVAASQSPPSVVLMPSRCQSFSVPKLPVKSNFSPISNSLFVRLTPGSNMHWQQVYGSYGGKITCLPSCFHEHRVGCHRGVGTYAPVYVTCREKMSFPVLATTVQACL